MKSKHLATFAVSLLLLAGHAGAAPVITTAQEGPNTPSTITDELAFAADISTTDLLHGNLGTGGSWNANGSSPNYLTDGLNGGDVDIDGLPALVGAAWAKDGTVSFREYTLGTGANGQGFDITRIQSIAAWQGAGFQNQKYQIWVSTVGDANFTLLITVDYQPAAWVSNDDFNAKGGATKVNVTDDTGILATGVDAIRFNFLDTVSPNNGGVVMREIDVFGTASVAASGFQLTITPATAPDTGFDLQWNSRPGKLYSLLTHTDLANPIAEWVVVQENIAATPPANFFNIQADGPRRFYAVKEFDGP